MNQSTYSNNKQQPRNPNQKLKMNSLEILEEALFNEEFERCAELIKLAKELGAGQNEIQKILNEYAVNIEREGNGVRRTTPRF